MILRPRSLLLLAAVLAGTPAALAETATDPLTVEARPTEDLKAVFATVESVHEASARARIAGTVADLRVTEGDKVAAGQVLATVRDPKLALQLAALDARIQSLDAQQRQAETELNRARALRASGTGTQQRLDDAQTALDVVRAQTAAMKAERAVTEQQLREGDVLAPAAGRVLHVDVIGGAVVMPGEPVATLAMETYVLRLRLPERHARFIRVGDPVLVGDRGLAATPEPAALKRGRVIQVYPEMAGGQVVADAEVTGLGDFFVGERVRVHVATGTRDAIVIPPDYVARRLGADFVRLADGSEAPVQVGGPVPAIEGRPGGLEILSGLKPGERIAKPGAQR
ncbi:MAG TPA: efflux RND transporter periplasmic adaptor subunit [Azospirillum sp.]|nr:efflux RND transporter periplasmic adaptor subunit [Azospirillum sp.]